MSQPKKPDHLPHGRLTPSKPGSNKGDATGGVIPYKNIPALLGYYMGLISLFPILGILFAIPAFVLGIVGLRERATNPAVKGSVHAWIGVIMGGLCTLLWGVPIALGIIAWIVSSL